MDSPGSRPLHTFHGSLPEYSNCCPLGQSVQPTPWTLPHFIISSLARLGVLSCIGAGTHRPVHARKVLYHWGTPQCADQALENRALGKECKLREERKVHCGLLKELWTLTENILNRNAVGKEKASMSCPKRQAELAKRGVPWWTSTPSILVSQARRSTDLPVRYSWITLHLPHFLSKSIFSNLHVNVNLYGSVFRGQWCLGISAVKLSF